MRREFELRAQGYSYEEILTKNRSEGFVPESLGGKYSKRGIEERLKNPLYWGYFYLFEDETRYPGKHELFIDAKILKAVEDINNGRTRKRKPILNGDDIFSGWLVCGHPECQRAVTYDPKKKTLKGTGEEVVYHYYRCSNSRKVHDKVPSVSEQKIWDQFEPAVEMLEISEDFAKDISAALNETHEKQRAAIKKQMEGFRLELRGLEGCEDRAYHDFTSGVLDKAAYQRQIKRIRDDRKHFEDEIERLTLAISDEAMVSVQKVFELAINAKSLWKSMERADRLEYLKMVCSNQALDGLTVQYQLQKPFARLALWKENKEWRRDRDSNPGYGFP